MSEVHCPDITRVMISPTATIVEIGIPALQKITRGKAHSLLAMGPDQSIGFVGDIDLSCSEQVELYHSRWYSWITRKPYKLDLGEDLKRNFDAFIRSSQELFLTDFDCLSFFLYMHGFYTCHDKGSIHTVRDNFSFFRILEPAGTEPLGTGFLISELPEGADLFSNNDFHIVLSLGNGMYISKLYAEGRVVVATWKELRKLYPFNTVSLVYQR